MSRDKKTKIIYLTIWTVAGDIRQIKTEVATISVLFSPCLRSRLQSTVKLYCRANGSQRYDVASVVDDGSTRTRCFTQKVISHQKQRNRKLYNARNHEQQLRRLSSDGWYEEIVCSKQRSFIWDLLNVVVATIATIVHRQLLVHGFSSKVIHRRSFLIAFARRENLLCRRMGTLCRYITHFSPAIPICYTHAESYDFTSVMSLAGTWPLLIQPPVQRSPHLLPTLESSNTYILLCCRRFTRSNSL